MGNADESLEFVVRGIPPEAIASFLDELWADILTTGSVANAEAVRVGIDVNALPRIRSEAIEIQPEGGPLDPATLAWAIAAKAAYDVWRYIVLERLRRKWGDKAISIQGGRATKSPRPLAKRRPGSKGSE